MSTRGELGISSAIVTPVVRALAELGLSLGVADTGTSDTLVPGASADATLDTAAARLNDDALGVSLAIRIPLGGLGTLDYALCTSPTLRDGLLRTARYYGVVTQRVKLSLVESPPRAALTFEREKGVSHSRHWLEFSFGIFARRIRETLGKTVVFDEVCFLHEAPKNTARHDAFFGTHVSFGASIDRLGFSSSLLELPLRTAAASLADVLEARMKQLEPTLDEDDAFVDKVRRVVAELLEKGDVRLSSAVSRLAVSRRTLQRELGSRGTSHSTLLDEARRARGRELLDTGGLTVAEVSERLGFSEPSSFFRAFRRWTGESPKAAQRRKQ